MTPDTSVAPAGIVAFILCESKYLVFVSTALANKVRSNITPILYLIILTNCLTPLLRLFSGIPIMSLAVPMDSKKTPKRLKKIQERFEVTIFMVTTCII